MTTVILGKTGIETKALAFGALPIQRTEMSGALAILHAAVEAGITFFDTARYYTDSEKKLGKAFGDGMRHKLFIATKSMGEDGATVERDFAVSLAELRTDYVDIFQFHNPRTVPRPDDGTGRYEAIEKLRKAGAIRHIGLTNHSLDRAVEAAESGLYATVQFPLNMLSTPAEERLAEVCRAHNVGLIGMKGLSGGLLTNIPTAFAYTRRIGNLLPIWGIQHMHELEEFIALDKNPPVWDEAMERTRQAEITALGGAFCRSCGYCAPCPQDIVIHNVARMKFLLRRSPWQIYTSDDWKEKMAKAKTCIECGLCASRCPYGLDTPALVKEHTLDYYAFMKEKGVSV